MEATGLLVEDHGDALNLKVFAGLVLRLADDLLGDLVGPLLPQLGIVLCNGAALLIDDGVNDFLDLWLDLLELVVLGHLRLLRSLHLSFLLD